MNKFNLGWYETVLLNLLKREQNPGNPWVLLVYLKT